MDPAPHRHGNDNLRRIIHDRYDSIATAFPAPSLQEIHRAVTERAGAEGKFIMFRNHLLAVARNVMITTGF